jgi:hypothetical protein
MAETDLWTDGNALAGHVHDLLRLVRGPGRAWLDLRGLSYLQLPMPERP